MVLLLLVWVVLAIRQVKLTSNILHSDISYIGSRGSSKIVNSSIILRNDKDLRCESISSNGREIGIVTNSGSEPARLGGSSFCSVISSRHTKFSSTES